jgi:hypothetical protein
MLLYRVACVDTSVQIAVASSHSRCILPLLIAELLYMCMVAINDDLAFKAFVFDTIIYLAGCRRSDGNTAVASRMSQPDQDAPVDSDEDCVLSYMC